MTSQATISSWFDRGLATGKNYMVVVCDTFDHSDSPRFVGPEEDVRQIVKDTNGEAMQKVMEVYDLTQNKIEQLAEARCFRLPPEPTPS